MSPIFPYITSFKIIIEKSSNFISEYWFENLNLRGGYKGAILNYIYNSYPDHYSAYIDIYTKGNKAYWHEYALDIEKYCNENNIAYKNYFYHEALVKS